MNHTRKPIRLRVPGLVDVLFVRDADQIRWLNQHPGLERELEPSASLLHALLDRRFRGDLSFARRVLPVFLSRSNTERAEQQKRLETRLDALCGRSSEERDRIAAYVAGREHPEEIGATVQEWCGRLFRTHYPRARDGYEAAKLLARWPSMLPWRAARARKSGELERAKATIEARAAGDLHCIHGTSIGMENVARTVRKLRAAAESGEQRGLPVETILQQCLTAPPAVIRGCSARIAAPFVARPLTPRTLVVFLVASAFAQSGDLDDAFLGNSWSECPARRVIPDMLRAVWLTARGDSRDLRRVKDGSRT